MRRIPTYVLPWLWLCSVLQSPIPTVSFVPPFNHASSSSASSSHLHARYTPPVSQVVMPPPPPPPPPIPEPPQLDGIDRILQNLAQKLDSSLPDWKNLHSPVGKDVQGPLIESVVSIQRQLGQLESDAASQIHLVSIKFQSTVLQQIPQLEPVLQKVTAFLAPLVQDPTTQLIVSALVSYTIVSKLLAMTLPPPPLKPYPSGRYDPVASRAYFDQRLPLVIARSFSILVQSLQFAAALLQDKMQNKLVQNEFQRGEQLAVLLSRLGPTFIKVGQSLSIRTDLLSPAYVRGLASLQDQVPAFDTAIAKQILEEEWQRPVSDVIVGELTSQPIAAASLGQVYKATLKSTGLDVAIKVQRPNINEQIALDMHLLREAAPVLKRLFNLNSDTVGTVDAWGTGFVDELDYIQEARNGAFFSERIRQTPLRDVVLAPAIVEDFTTGSILVTEWIDGERLDKSEKGDVTVLCSIAMNTYLTMLLELGLLHCDPHPGNLLRTPDGKLCVLDWGMVTAIDKDLQLTLIEHMAHLTSADYGEIPRDLLLLGFIPSDKAHLIDDSGVVDVLADIYGAWTKGGGAAAINVNDVVNQLQDLTSKKGNLFQIPPYFAYIAKSFSVLEGIGLSNEPNYSIINECLPYVSKRLLTDKEKMGPALSTFIFGPAKSNADRIVDYRRVEQLVEGFGEYTTSASGSLLGKQNMSNTEILEDVADEVLDLVLTEEETPLQEILLEQLAKIITASSRSIWTQIRERSGYLPSGRTVLGTIVDPFGLFRTSPLVRMNELDERTVETTQKLIALAQKQIQKSDNPAFDLSKLSREEALQFSSILVRKVWVRRGGVVQTSNRFARKLLQLTAEKLEAGERDTRTLPIRTNLTRTEPLIEAEKSFTERSSIELADHHPMPVKAENPRLIAARRRLDALKAEDGNGVIVTEAAEISSVDI